MNNTLIILDFNRTIYDPDTAALSAGAQEMLDALAERGATLVLVSRREGDRATTLEELGMSRYFREVCFVDEKDAPLFERLIRAHAASAEETYVIGDHLHSEIRTGNRVGARTIHVKQGKFAGLIPETAADEPWRTVSNLHEALALLCSHGHPAGGV